MIELYGKIAWLTIIMWSFYPVVWLFSEGFASFSVSFEVSLLSRLHRCECTRFIAVNARDLPGWACEQEESAD